MHGTLVYSSRPPRRSREIRGTATLRCHQQHLGCYRCMPRAVARQTHGADATTTPEADSVHAIICTAQPCGRRSIGDLAAWHPCLTSLIATGQLVAHVRQYPIRRELSPLMSSIGISSLIARRSSRSERFAGPRGKAATPAIEPRCPLSAVRLRSDLRRPRLA